jgi:hypothetical protein
VCGFRLNGTIRSKQYGGHKTQRAIALRDEIGLNVTVVVLAGPDVPSFSLMT